MKAHELLTAILQNHFHYVTEAYKQCLDIGTLVNGNHDRLRQLREIARNKDDQQMLLNLTLLTKGADDVRLRIETLSAAGQFGAREAKRIIRLEHLDATPDTAALPARAVPPARRPNGALRLSQSHTQELPEEDHDDDSSDGQADDAGADEWAPHQEARSDAHRARARRPQPHRGFDGRRPSRRGG